MKKPLPRTHICQSRLPMHLILVAREYAKLRTESAPKIGEPGEPVAQLTKFGWIMMSPGVGARICIIIIISCCCCFIVSCLGFHFFVFWFGHIRLVIVLVYFALSFSSTFIHTL